MMQGDFIPLHDHTTRPLSQHLTIVAKGRVEVNFPNTGETLAYVAGDVFDYTPEQQAHEITATEDSILFNVFKATLP
jgi:quercetin dioxygenase-like cupin family protein